MNKADLVFLIDVSADDDIPVILRFVYNCIRLFKPGTTLTLVPFTNRPSELFRRKAFPNEKLIRTFLNRMKPHARKGVDVGIALKFVREKIIPKLNKATPIITFVIMQQSSRDNVKIPAEQLKGNGVTVTAIGKSHRFK